MNASTVAPTKPSVLSHMSRQITQKGIGNKTATTSMNGLMTLKAGRTPVIGSAIIQKIALTLLTPGAI